MWHLLILALALSSNADSISSAAQPSRHKRDGEESAECEPWMDPLLPDNIEPIRYDLYFWPRFYNGGTEFYGRVTIDLNVLNQTKTIIVHVKEFSITEYRLYDSKDAPVTISKWLFYAQNDYFVLQTSEFMLGKMKLTFAFHGYFSLVRGSAFKRSGVYNIPYEDGRYLVVSDFRPNKARYIFPNFDEARFKANFIIRLHHKRTHIPLSNMPARGVETETQTVDSDVTVFYESPKLSSSQVVLALTDFRRINKTVDGMQLSIYAQASRLARMNYTLEVSSNILSHLHQELDMAYYFEKLDLLAIPGDALAAQEDSWKFVIFQESTLLFNDTTGGEHARSKALIIMTRILTRNYFGSLVTCRCLDDAWLNEGLATFYEIRIVTELDPTGLYNEYMFGWKVDAMMYEDALEFPGSLVSPLDLSPEPTPGAYAYKQSDKGAAILRMVENIVGADSFTRGIRQFLRQNVNTTVLTDDLWVAIQQEYNDTRDIKTVMANWMEKTGHPVVKVELLPGNRINATQKQFLYLFSPPNETTSWYVPLTYRTKGGIEGVAWMDETDVIFEIPDLASGDWIEFNIDRTGYYRVNYGDDLWNLLAKQLNEDHTVFSELSRARLYSDASVLVRAGEMAYDVFLNVTRYAAKETDLISWFHIHVGLQEFAMLINSTTYCCIQNYIQNLTNGMMDRLQVEAEGSPIEQELRPKIVSLSCTSGHDGCRANLTRAYTAWIESDQPNVVRQNLIRFTSCTALADVLQEPMWTTTFEKYKRTTSASDRSDLLRVLSCAGDLTLLERLLDYSLNETFVRDSPSHMVIHYIAKNPLSENVGWNWLKSKYLDIAMRVGSWIAENYFFISAVKTLNTPAHYQEVVEFCEAHTEFTEQNKEIAKGYVQTRICWLEKNSDVIAQWLEQNIEN